MTLHHTLHQGADAKLRVPLRHPSGEPIDLASANSILATLSIGYMAVQKLSNADPETLAPGWGRLEADPDLPGDLLFYLDRAATAHWPTGTLRALVCVFQPDAAFADGERMDTYDLVLGQVVRNLIP